jgi:hypothetical protein
MKVTLGKFKKKGKRVEKVVIHKWDCWNVNHSIAVIAYPLLKRFKKESASWPAHMNREKWHEILDKIIWSMKIMAEEEGFCPMLANPKKFYAKLSQGLNLFGKYFRNLWY